MSTTPRADFDSSAKRHMADAELLHVQSRPANADHLAGLAAECALKALIAGFLGGHVDQKSLVVHPHTGQQIKQHINTLWPEMSTIVRDRAANVLTPVLTSQPFADWSVNERYCDGSHLTPAAVTSHLSAARTVIGILEQAHLDGMLT
ncbi:MULTISPECIES: hypothetical protein [unclassified Crossiella]|uniref:hypothetical protein n=1 Tax=unclassified Crossiella TaxID=2620835 RepID=UPI001FFFD828|nr:MULTISPECIES: hypothetical protein [unclassified Crossiella]MCK2240340.1 hypothetical protein [Crossiella sp. S99.2]MCK2253208.1 hypothetical protein [Crossiella sp. S99.1]